MKRSINIDLFAALIGFLIMGMFWIAGQGVGHLSIMFPDALLLLIGGFSLILLIKSFVKADRAPIFNEGNQVRVIVTGVVLVAWVIGIMYIGFLVTSLVMFPFTVCYLASARQKLTPKKIGLWSAVSAAEVVVFYFIFTQFLQVPLPMGILI